MGNSILIWKTVYVNMWRYTVVWLRKNKHILHTNTHTNAYVHSKSINLQG